MFRSVKISEDAYRKAKRLADELDREAVGKVGLSNAIAYAVKKTLEGRSRRKDMLSAAGGWSDVDGDKLIKEIYEGRLLSTRPEPRI